MPRYLFNHSVNSFPFKLCHNPKKQVGVPCSIVRNGNSQVKIICVNHTSWGEKPQDPPGPFDLLAVSFALEYELAAKGGRNLPERDEYFPLWSLLSLGPLPRMPPLSTS